MKLILIYNKNSSTEKNVLNRLITELETYVETIEVLELNEAREKYPIRATPAIIPIRDDLQGESLLNETETGLRAVAEAYKMMQEEEKNIYNIETNRIDYLVGTEVTSKMGENYQVMQDMISLLQESEVL